MASVLQAKRGISVLFHVAVLVLALSSIADVTHGAQWVVGGDVQKWSFLHANAPLTFFNDWADDNKTFSTGDTLLFEYDNATHSVMQLSEADFAACNLNTPITSWFSGNDVVFISEAGTFYYVCGAPMHCAQGMKVAITASGAPVPAPPPPTPPLSIIPPPGAPSSAVALTSAPIAASLLLGACFAASGLWPWW